MPLQVFSAGELITTRRRFGFPTAAAGPLPTYTNPVTSGLVAHYDASAITGLSDGDPVSSWPDSSTTALAATQATSSFRPTYRTAPTGFGGRPALSFDGVDDTMLGGSRKMTTAGATSFFIVARPNTSDTAYRTYYQSSGYSVSEGTNVSSDSQSNGTWNANEILVFTRGYGGGLPRGFAPRVTPNTSAIIGGRMGATAAEIRSNGSVITRVSGTGSNFDVNDTMVISVAFGGNIAEIMVWNRQLSQVEAENVEDLYLSPKYGITVA